MDWRLLLTVWRESCWCGVAVGGEPRLRLLACWSLELLLTACYFRLILLLLFTVLLATGISRLEQEKRSCCEKGRIGSGRCLATVERLLLLTLLALNSREATGVCCCLDRKEQITLVLLQLGGQPLLLLMRNCSQCGGEKLRCCCPRLK
jgi:hypothetical protein